VSILERLYAIFRLSPFGAPRIRAITKAQKHYHLDWSLVPEQPRRFENLVACHLLKWVHHGQDAEGRDLELRYFRDSDGREVDFVVTEGGRCRFLVECKWDDRGVDRNLRYLRERVEGGEAWQISAVGTRDFVAPGGIRVAPALTFLSTLV
jgi:predicted AAA+ superfamily ATPase